MGSEEEEASADWVAGDPQGGARVGGAVNEFPVAAVTNYQKLRDLQQDTSIIMQLRRSKVQNGFLG